MRNTTGIYRALQLINEILGEYNPVVRVAAHSVDPETGAEYLSLRVRTSHPAASITIREYWRNSLVAYGYYVRLGGYEEWWDNRPHHPELNTHPHHRHVGGRVLPLNDHSLEAFLRRVRELLAAGSPAESGTQQPT